MIPIHTPLPPFQPPFHAAGRQFAFVKCSTGVVIFTALAILLWLPLLLFSSANPALQANPVAYASYEVAFGGLPPLYAVELNSADAATAKQVWRVFRFYCVVIARGGRRFLSVCVCVCVCCYRIVT